MRYSFVFTNGRMCADGELVEADHRLYHLDLPRGAGLTDEVHGTVDGQEVSIPAIDVLGAIRATSGESLWLQSGSLAHLTAANPQPHDRDLGLSFLRLVQASMDRGELTAEVEPPRYREGDRIKKRWEPVEPELERPPVFDTREQAEAWSARRAFARKVGWAYVRLDKLLDDADTYPTIGELLAIADYFGEAPSTTLARAQEVA